MTTIALALTTSSETSYISSNSGRGADLFNATHGDADVSAHTTVASMFSSMA